MSGSVEPSPACGRGQGEGGAAAASLGPLHPLTSTLSRTREREKIGDPLPQAGERVVRAARAWLGTPYRHQASVRGVGCDCLGLMRGVWREMRGGEAETVPAYRPDWAEVGGRETLLEAARRHLIEVPLGAMRPGDVLLFRMTPQAVVKHAAILTALPNAADPQPRMIHAYWGRAVVESWIGPWWRRRLAFAFRFPEV